MWFGRIHLAYNWDLQVFSLQWSSSLQPFIVNLWYFNIVYVLFTIK